MEGNCRNCNTILSGKYCSQCGQKRFERNNLTFKNFVSEFAEEAFDFDSKIFNTVKLLVLKPGKLTKEYTQGRQALYLSPVKLYLVIITLHFLLYSYFDLYSLIEVNYLLQLGGQTRILNDIQNQFIASGLPEEVFYHQLNQKVNDTFSITLYLLIFLFAGIVRLYYSRLDKYYIEILIFCLHFMSFGFLRDMLLLPLQVFHKDLALTISLITTILYFYFSIKVVFDRAGWKRVADTIILYGIFFILFTAIIVFSVVFNVYV